MPVDNTPRGLLAGAAILLAAGAGIGLLNNLLASGERKVEWVARYGASPPRPCSDDPLPAEPLPPSAPDGATVPPGGPAPPPEIPPGAMFGTLSSEQAFDLHRSGAYFVDARATSIHREGHIPGSRSIPVWEAGVDQKIEEISWDVPDKGYPIVTYCSGGDCSDSHLLAEKIAAAGYTQIFVYTEGFPDWVQKGRPVTRESQP